MEYRLGHRHAFFASSWFFVLFYLTPDSKVSMPGMFLFLSIRLLERPLDLGKVAENGIKMNQDLQQQRKEFRVRKGNREGVWEPECEFV